MFQHHAFYFISIANFTCLFWSCFDHALHHAAYSVLPLSTISLSSLMWSGAENCHKWKKINILPADKQIHAWRSSCFLWGSSSTSEHMCIVVGVTSRLQVSPSQISNERTGDFFFLFTCFCCQGYFHCKTILFRDRFLFWDGCCDRTFVGHLLLCIIEPSWPIDCCTRLSWPSEHLHSSFVCLLLLLFSGKKNKLRVYYLSWLRNKIIKGEEVCSNKDAACLQKKTWAEITTNTR